jgi:hypothetical protein
MNINGGTITSSVQPDSRNHHAVYGNNAESFYTFNAAAWWLMMIDTVVVSRAQRNAR